MPLTDHRSTIYETDIKDKVKSEETFLFKTLKESDVDVRRFLPILKKILLKLLIAFVLMRRLI